MPGTLVETVDLDTIAHALVFEHCIPATEKEQGGIARRAVAGSTEGAAFENRGWRPVPPVVKI
jgi:hypothetical protein